MRIVVLLAATGCFAKPGPPGAIDDATVDTALDDGAVSNDGRTISGDAQPALCTISEDFSTSGEPCGTWGVPEGATLTRSAFQLFATPATDSAMCRTHPLTSSGTLTVLLSSVAHTADGHYTMFSLNLQGGGASFQVYRDVGVDKFYSSCGGVPQSANYSSSTHRYLRFELVPQGNDLLVSLLYSSVKDSGYTPFGSCMILSAAQSTATASFGSAIDGVLAGTPTSVWDDLFFNCQ